MHVSPIVQRRAFAFREGELTTSEDNTGAPANDTSGDEDDTEESEEE